MKLYFDNYEMIVSFSLSNQRSYCKAETFSDAILPAFGAYCLLQNIPVAAWERSLFEQYIAFLYDTPGDVIEKILSIEEMDKRRGFTELYYEFDSAKQALLQTSGLSCPALENAARIEEAVFSPNMIETLFSVSPVPGTPVVVHVSPLLSRELHMFTFRDLGVVLVIGEQADIPTHLKDNRQNYLEVFKALADESRLNIVSVLLDEPMTVSEIAARVNLTLSTVNHHIKSLMLTGIVAMETKTAPGRGVRYTVNQPKIRHLLREFAQLFQIREDSE